MTKNNQEFGQFLKDEVELNKSRLDRLETAVGGVNGYLKDNLPGYQTMERQGSYALDTLVKPVDDNDEYDADVQIVMNPNPRWEAQGLRPRDQPNPGQQPNVCRQAPAQDQVRNGRLRRRFSS